MTQKDKIAAPSEPARARLKGWVKAAFIASVTLNLLVAGVVVGGIIRHDRHPPRPMISDVSIGPFTEALSQNDREALRRAAQRESTGFRAMRQAAREDYRRLIAALRAEPLDEAVVQEVFASRRQRLTERSAFGERLMVERVKAMSAAERQDFADRLERMAERRERMPDRAKGN